MRISDWSSDVCSSDLDIDKGELTVDVALSNTATPSDAVRITARDKGKVIASTIIRGNRQGVLKIPNARLWSPDDPYLYDLTAELVKEIGSASLRERVCQSV